MRTLVVDLARCNGCYNCQLVCKDEHCGTDWSPYAKPQPMTGQFWCRVDQEERGRVPVVKVNYTPVFCGMCDDAACMAADAHGAVTRREDGLVIIDPEKAKGARELVNACPAGMIFYNEELDIAQKCTGCAHLLGSGWEVPRCVDACATDALRVVDVDESASLGADSSCLNALVGKGSHVVYLNKPMRFITACVADRVANEVVIGAVVTVFDESGSVVAQVETDEFGDFMIDQLNEMRYRLRIEAQGFAPIELEADCSERDVVFDDIFVVGLNL